MKTAANWVGGALAVTGVAASLTPVPSLTTYSDHIRPLLAQKCVSCHHAEGLGPFALQTYAQARRRGDLVRLVSLTGQMPPTDARSDFGALTPHQPLTQRELRDIQEWYRLGMPEGSKTSPLVPAATAKPSYRNSVGKGQKIPAEGRNAVVTYPLNSLQGQIGTMSGFSFQPDAPQAVRQVVVAIQRVGEPTPFTSTGLRPGTAHATWAPGFNQWRTPSAGFTLGKGDRLWLRLSAVPTGKMEVASGILSIDFSPELTPIRTRTMGNRGFVIRPEELAVLRDEWKLEQDIDLIAVLPEARFVTDQVRLIAQDETGQRIAFMVHTWDATWAGAYNFPKMVRLKKGTTLIYEASITNSKHGHAAEDEQATTLRFGPKSTDELFWCHLNYIPR